jgi:hypothetical protein
MTEKELESLIIKQSETILILMHKISLLEKLLLSRHSFSQEEIQNFSKEVADSLTSLMHQEMKKLDESKKMEN